MTGRPAAARSRQGFTLLELLVVLVIAGLLLTIAPPLFFGAGSTTEVKGKARELAAALRRTRSEAITRNRPLALVLDLEARQFTAAGTNPRDLPADLDIALRLASDVWATPSARRGDAARGGRILFFPDGSSTGGSITLRTAGAGYEVTVDWLTGQVSIDDRPAAAR